MKAAAIRHATCERDFVYKSLKQGIRLDGRQSHDYRDITVEFGKDFGNSDVKLGDTRALAQVSCEIVKPRESRPSDGQLHINVDLSPMASPAFENGRMGDYGIEINRILERCIKESKAVDVESLCLVAGEKVWAIRVDVFILNDAGNLVDCACIAAIAALANFRRPDVTVSSNEITIHSVEEKEYIPLNVHHMPVCTTYGFVDNGEQVIIDPEEKEEGVTTGRFTIATNVHHEICCAHVSGELTLDAEQILQCANVSLVKSNDITEIIKAALQQDETRRAPPPVQKRHVGDKEGNEKVKTIAEPTYIGSTERSEGKNDQETRITNIARHFNSKEKQKQPVENLGRAIGTIDDSIPTGWTHSDSEEENTQNPSRQSILKADHNQNENVDMDSEEEEVHTLLPDDLDQNTRKDTKDTPEVQTPGTENKPPVTTDIKQTTGKKKKKKKRKAN